MLGALKLVGRIAGGALHWIGVALKVVTRWAAAHPYLAVAVGVGAYVLGNWLSEQTWAGAHILGEVVRTFGIATTAAGVGGFVWKPLGRFLGRGAALAYVGRGLPYQPYTTIGLAFIMGFLLQAGTAWTLPDATPVSFDSFLDGLM